VRNVAPHIFLILPIIYIFLPVYCLYIKYITRIESKTILCDDSIHFYVSINFFNHKIERVCSAWYRWKNPLGSCGLRYIVMDILS